MSQTYVEIEIVDEKLPLPREFVKTVATKK